MKRKRTGTVKSYDGTKIYYEVQGEGLPLIFCYGVVCNSKQWKFQTRHFKKKYQVIHFDYRGHNKSGRPKNSDNLTLAGCAQDLKAVMDKLEIKQAILLGHSMGVNVIFQFSALYPKRVLALVAICGTVGNPLKTMFNTDLSQAGFEFLKLTYLKFPDQFPTVWKKTIPSTVSRIITGILGFNYQLTERKEVKNYLDGVASQPAETFFHLLQDMSKFKGDKILKKVKAPTLIIAGERDLITPFKNSQALYRKIKSQAQFLRVPQGSHCSHMDLPELVNLRIEKFFHNQKLI